MTEWDEYMHDFVPEDISTVVINPRAKHVYNFSILLTFIRFSM